MYARGHVIAALFVLFVVAAGPLFAAPFDRQISFRQPGGTTVQLHGWGDEFYAFFESLDGYTVVFDPAAKAYYYASLSPDQQRLLPTKLQVGKGNPAKLGIAKHLRISAEARKAQAEERRLRWEEGTHNAERWAQQKALRRAPAPPPGGPAAAPPADPTTGTKVGLCILIDFSDAVATIPKGNIDSFCNGDTYTGYGNNGSVKQYYHDVSNGLLTYTNVVTAYVRVPNPKSYYNDTTKDCGIQGNLLIKDAIAAMRALPNYEAEILPTFADLTVDASSDVVACNVFYAGDDGGVWGGGLWPHSWSLWSVGAQELSSGGAKVWDYEISNIGSSLALGTFCHENGHMLCNFPDLYDYDYDSVGGAGDFCVMSYGSSGTNPAQVCAYLKYAAGWTTITELTSASESTLHIASSGTDFNHFYRYAKPGVPTEYYLLENRQKSGRDAGLPAAGIAVWHVDEQGNRDNQSLVYNSSHANYELTLVQADNLWHFENNLPYTQYCGDANDLYYSGNTAAAYLNLLTDYSMPKGRWWDGTNSGLVLQHFSANAVTMTVDLGGEPPLPLTITTASLPSGNTNEAYSATLAATGGTPPYSWWMAPEESLSSHISPSGGTAQGWHGDETSWTYTLPFAFPYMGKSYTSVYVCANGCLDFANSTADYVNSDAKLRSNVRIAPFWYDLITNGYNQTGEDIYIRRPDADTVVFRWVAEVWNDGDPVNFDVLLRRNGGIEFHYGSGNTGLSPTIGLGSGDPSGIYRLSTLDGSGSLANAQTVVYQVPIESGLSLDAATGQISGTPTAGGSPTITFVCRSSIGEQATKDLTLQILTPPRSLDVASTPFDGVVISSTTGHNGTTGYHLDVNDSTTVTLTAPSFKSVESVNYHFVNWTGAPQGASFSNGGRTISFAIRGGTSLTANYAINSWTLSVNSTPISGVVISSTTGHNGTTHYEKTVADYAAVELMAPLSAGGQYFVCWQNNQGTVLSYGPEWSGIVTANVTLVAVYGSLRLIIPSDDGLALRWGQPVNIQWASSLSSKTLVKLTLWDSGGSHWDLVPSTANKGVYTWTVGSWKSKTQTCYPQGTGYRLCVSTVLDGTVQDTSDYPFSIGSVTALAVTGANVATPAPATVSQNSSTQFTCKGTMNYGAPVDVTGQTVWKITDPAGKSLKCAKMGKTGLLTTLAVTGNTPCLITATSGKGTGALTATTTITITKP